MNFCTFEVIIKIRKIDVFFQEIQRILSSPNRVVNGRLNYLDMSPSEVEVFQIDFLYF